MKTIVTIFGLAYLVSSSFGQLFVYDQQSADENYGGQGLAIQDYQPLGQSFTPTLDSVGFIRLQLGDGISGNGQGATLYVNLRANSITGTVLSTTSPVFMPDGFGVGNDNRGFTDFSFSAPVPVTPGVTYYFQPVVQSGDLWSITAYNYNYAGGTAFAKGIAAPNDDLWFREGIIVPEPAATALILVGGSMLVWRGRKQCLNR